MSFFRPLALGAFLMLAALPCSAASTRDFALKSNVAYVVDLDTGEAIAAKNADAIVPVASLTKLMTALVVLESGSSLDAVIEITADDRYAAKPTPSKLPAGTRLTRGQLLLLALMASENRSAMALSRHYPGGRSAFLARMNAKARELGMSRTHFVDPAGLSSGNVSTARELHLLMQATAAQPLIRAWSTQPEAKIRINKRGTHRFVNSNLLVRRHHWRIEMQKTGYTSEAGRCLVMQTRVAGRRLAMIFLDSYGKLTRYGDASRVRERLESEQRKGGRSAAGAAP